MPYQPVAQPVARLLAALELLQTHRRVTGGELAERLQVDKRTARRYVARLIEMGVPIDADRGRDGAYRLTAGYKLPPMMFSDDEALALAMGLVAARDLGLGEARLAVHSALDKLERVMPENLRVRVRAVGRAVRLDLRRSSKPSHAQALATLSEAIQKQQRVRLLYQPRPSASMQRAMRATTARPARRSRPHGPPSACSMPGAWPTTPATGTPWVTATCAAGSDRFGSIAWSRCNWWRAASRRRRSSTRWPRCATRWPRCRASIRSRWCCTPRSTSRATC